FVSRRRSRSAAKSKAGSREQGAGSKKILAPSSPLPANTEWIPMFASKLQIRLPRRITAYFLLFGMAALLWLSVAIIYIAHSVFESRSESASLRSLGQASDRFNLAYLRNKSADLQPLLSEIRARSRADYCDVVADSGEYLAHTTSAYKGKPAGEQGNVTDRWG